MSDDESMIAQYLAQGGKVTKCAPGPSDNVVYRNGPRFRRNPKPQGEAAPEGAAVAAPASEPPAAAPEE